MRKLIPKLSCNIDFTGVNKIYDLIQKYAYSVHALSFRDQNFERATNFNLSPIWKHLRANPDILVLYCPLSRDCCTILSKLFIKIGSSVTFIVCGSACIRKGVFSYDLRKQTKAKLPIDSFSTLHDPHQPLWRCSSKKVSLGCKSVLDVSQIDHPWPSDFLRDVDTNVPIGKSKSIAPMTTVCCLEFANT